MTAGRGLGRVHVGMRVDPDQAELLLLFAEVARHSGDRADRDGMIAAQYQRHFALIRRSLHHPRETQTGGRDLGEVFCVRRPLR